MAKQPLDLYRLFKLVVERGGLVEVRALVFVFVSVVLLLFSLFTLWDTMFLVVVLPFIL